MKGLRTWRNLSETTAPLEISPKTRGLSWGECREVQKKKKTREKDIHWRRQKVPPAQQKVVATIKSLIFLSPTVLFYVLYSSNLCSSIFFCHLLVVLMGKKQPLTLQASHPLFHFVIFSCPNQVSLTFLSFKCLLCEHNPMNDDTMNLQMCLSFLGQLTSFSELRWGNVLLVDTYPQSTGCHCLF